MSNKYPATTFTMEEAARRFHTLFGFFPDYIGVNPGNNEALTRSVIRFPKISKYLDTLMAEKPVALYDLTPVPSYHEVAIKTCNIGMNDFILWSEKTGAIDPELVFEVNGKTVEKMIGAMGYKCCMLEGEKNRSYDLFSIRSLRGDNVLFLNLSLSHYEYKYPELLPTVLEQMVARKFKEAQQLPNKAKINIDASKIMKNMKKEETCHTMPIKPAKIIFPLNGEMYEIELDQYEYTQEVSILSGLTCHFEGDSIKPAKPLKKEAAAGRLTLEDGATYELYPVTEL